MPDMAEGEVAALVDVTPDQTAERISDAVPVARLAPDGAESALDGTNRHFIGR